MMKYILSFVISLVLISKLNADCAHPYISYVSTDLPIVKANSISVVFHIFYNETDNGDAAWIEFNFGDGIIDEIPYNDGTDIQITHEYLISSVFVNNGVFSVTAHTELMGVWCNVINDLLISAFVSSTGYQLGITPIPDYRGQGYPDTQTAIQFSYYIVSDHTPTIGELQLSIMNNSLGTLVYSDVVDPSNINQTISLTDDKYKFPIIKGITNTFQAFLYSYGVQVTKSDPVDIVIGTGTPIVDCSNPPDPVLTVDPIMIDMNNLSGTYQVLDINDRTPMDSKLVDCAQYFTTAHPLPGQVYFHIIDDKNNMGYSPYTYPVAAADRYFYGTQPYLNDASANPYKVYKNNYDVESDVSYINAKLIYSYTTVTSQSVVRTVTQKITIYSQTCDDNSYLVVNNSVTINSHTAQCIGIVFYNPSNQIDDFSYISNIQINKTNRTITLTFKDNYELNDRNIEMHIFVSSGYGKCYSAENGNYRNVKITQPTLTSDIKYSNSDKTKIPNYTPPANAAYFKITGPNDSKYVTNCNDVPIDLISDVSDNTGVITIDAYDNKSVLINTKTFTFKICKCVTGCFNTSDIPNYDVYIAYNPDATTIGNTQITNKSVEIYSPTIVQLRPGFSVSNGANFSADIKNCSTLKSAPLNKDSADFNIANNIVSKTNPINFQVFPNPSKGIFNIVTDDVLTEKNNYVVVDISGKFILGGPINKSQTTIDMSGYKAGFYILRISTSNSYIFKKLIIN